jgi:hypothetical protein
LFFEFFFSSVFIKIPLEILNLISLATVWAGNLTEDSISGAGSEEHGSGV